MGLISYLLRKLRDREQRRLDRNWAEADAKLDRDEAAGEKIQMSDKDLAGLKRVYDSYGSDREKDRERIRRIARLAGRKLRKHQSSPAIMASSSELCDLHLGVGAGIGLG